MLALAKFKHVHFGIRPARPADTEALANLHVAVWQSAYRGILPDAYLDALTSSQRLPFWQEILHQPEPGRLTLVLQAEDGSLGGFLSAGPPRDLPPGGAALYRSELYAINILPGLHGRGHGRRLLLHAANWMAEQHLTPFYLWLLADNTKARDFYEMLGASLAAKRSVSLAGTRLTELAYHFLDPADIARRALKAAGRRL
ncbi:MAG: GNAT family N-acetyltransferase [Ferrovibrio sp.]|nr:GNAT family N-acetyltransferase [Ferrovibrio sp.]